MNLVDLLSEGSEGGGAKTRRVGGVAVGVVTDNKDPDNLGRVKVKFPWLGEDSESEWAKVASMMGGKERGAYFLPEVDDEVLVAFEQGDIDHPYVVGALWSSEDKPPANNSDGKNNVRTIRSRSGHVITFQDDRDSGQEKLIVQTNAGHKLVLDDSTGAEKIELVDKSGQQKIVMDSNQNSIAIESAMKISIKATQIEIEAQGQLKLSSSGVTTVKGSVVQIN